MADQTTAFPKIPAVRTPLTDWTCTKCGNDDQRRVRVIPGRPSLDPRYALGHCDDCAPVRRRVRGLAREIVPLVQSRLFDREAHLARQAYLAEQKLLARYRAGHVLTEDETLQVKAIVARLEKR